MRLENKNKIEQKEPNFQNIWFFLFISKLKNSWISDDYQATGIQIPIIDVYLRKSRRIINNQLFEQIIDVANISIYEEHRNKGFFVKFIQDLQKYGYPIFIESVINPYLKKSLIENKHRLNFKLIEDFENNSNFIWIPEKVLVD